MQPAVAFCYIRPRWGAKVAKKEIDPEDGLVVDVVGPWASEKHLRLREYIRLARGARANFVTPKGTG